MGALQEAARPRTDHERDVRCNDVHSKWRSSQCSSFFYVAGSKLGETLNLMVNTSASELGSLDLRTWATNTGSPMPSREQQFFGCDTTDSTCSLTDDGFAFCRQGRDLH